MYIHGRVHVCIYIIYVYECILKHIHIFLQQERHINETLRGFATGQVMAMLRRTSDAS